jgi:phage terminase large subunit
MPRTQPKTNHAVSVSLPAGGWKPRHYQQLGWDAFMSGINRLVYCWHRRAGKDEMALHMAAVYSQLAPGNIWHMLPNANQARKAIWEAVNPHTARRRIDEAFPMEIRESTRESDMFIRFKNGATWQVVGSDNFDSLVGSPPKMVVFSEYALANPNAWAYLSPILDENGGLAVFISTPRGRNHFWKLVELCRTEPGWYGDVVTVLDSGAISQEQVEKRRRELAAERGEREADALIAQEYYCDPDSSIPGAYFADLMAKAEQQGRIGDFSYNPSLPVGVACDLGIRDSSCFWFWQEPEAGKVRLIDFLECSGVGLDWIAKKIREKPYVIGDFILPHDGNSQQLNATGQSISDQLRVMGLNNRVQPRTLNKQLDIQALRKVLTTCEVVRVPVPDPGETLVDSRARMERGLSGLRSYQRKWNDNLKRFDDRPLHDWSSHICDAALTLAMGRSEMGILQERKPIKLRFASMFR